MGGCGSRTKKYYENEKLRYEVVSKNEKNQVLREYNSSEQVIAEYEMVDSVKNGLGRHFKNGELDFKTNWIEGQQSVIIEDVSGDNQIELEHNFPDTVMGGDTVRAVIASKNEDWQIVDAYVNCPIGHDGIFRIYKRTKFNCLPLPVTNNQTLIQFVTIGKGEKVFDKVTLILENGNGVNQATEIQFKYYLK